MKKLHDKIIEDYPGLVDGIWFYEGYKSDKIIKEDSRYYLNYLAKILYTELGQAVKNIDDFIFERLYRGLYASILVKCPDQKIIEKKSAELLGKFINKL